MANLLLIFICLLLGILMQKISIFPKNTSIVLNQYVLFIALPAMALYYLPNLQLEWQLIFPASVAWITFALAFVFFTLLGKMFNWSKRLIGCLTLTAGLGNTSFVGIPIIQAIYGDEGIKTLIVIDLPGTFVTMSTVGLIVATLHTSQKNESESIVRKIFSFPPLLAFIIGVSMAILKIEFPSALSESFQKIGVTLSPIALISVGFQLKLKLYGKHFRHLALGLLFKLILVPCVIFVLFRVGFGKTDLATQVCIVEAAMPPMITGAIIAQKYGLKPELSSMMVGYGIPISFLTIALWYALLTYCF